MYICCSRSFTKKDLLENLQCQSLQLTVICLLFIVTQGVEVTEPSGGVAISLPSRPMKIQRYLAIGEQGSGPSACFGKTTSCCSDIHLCSRGCGRRRRTFNRTDQVIQKKHEGGVVKSGSTCFEVLLQPDMFLFTLIYKSVFRFHCLHEIHHRRTTCASCQIQNSPSQIFFHNRADLWP